MFLKLGVNELESLLKPLTFRWSDMECDSIQLILMESRGLTDARKFLFSAWLEANMAMASC